MFTPRSYIKMRTLDRHLRLYNPYDGTAVFGALERKGIPPMKVIRTLKRFERIGLPGKQIFGGLALVYKLDTQGLYKFLQ